MRRSVFISNFQYGVTGSAVSHELWPCGLFSVQPCGVGYRVDISWAASSYEEVFKRCRNHPWQPGGESSLYQEKPFQKFWTKMEGKGSVHNLPWTVLVRWVNSYCIYIQLIDMVLCSSVPLLSAAATFEVTSEVNFGRPLKLIQSVWTKKFVLMLESEITICNSFIQNRLNEGTDQKSICPLSFLDTLCYRSNYKALLKDALTKIKNLEEEMAHFRQKSTLTTIFSLTNHIQNLISADTGSETSALGSRSVGSAMAVAQILPSMTATRATSYPL